MQTIRGKRAFVTGAARGVGRAIALALAKEGAELFLLDIDEPNLRLCAREVQSLGSRAVVGVCDLSNSAEITACVTACLDAFGGLDILVNCAAVLHFGHVNEMAVENWNSALSINLLAPIQLVREFLPALAAQRESHILNVCSVLGLVPTRKVSSYQTSKFGLVGFSLALRTSFFAQNIGVTALCPALVDTPMLKLFGPRWLKDISILGPFSPVLSTEAVARKAISAIRANRGLIVLSISGKLLWVVYRLSPTLFVWLFSRKFRLRSRKRLPLD